ncbi:MAG: hypothetical protein Q9210_007458 [Variospora velana]
MRSFIASAALLAGVAAAHGHSNSTAPAEYTTEVVTAYVTFCPSPTEIVHGSSTITVTEATTLTISDCPGGCTVVNPVVPTIAPETSVSPVQPTSVIPAPVTPITSVPTVAPVSPTTLPAPITEHLPSSVSGSPVVPITTGVPPVSAVSPVIPPIYVNSTGPGVPTTPVVSVLPTGTAAPSGTGVGSSPVAPFEGAAPKMAASGASLVALLGLAVFFL